MIHNCITQENNQYAENEQIIPLNTFIVACAALPTTNAGQYSTSHCKPLLFWFPCKRWYINVGSF